MLWVVGLPVHLDGRESAKSREARSFGQWLGQVTGVPVEFFDERFTTSEAEQLLLGAGLTGKRRKRRSDMVAAQIMLGAYLESRTKGLQSPPGPWTVSLKQIRGWLREESHPLQRVGFISSSS